MTIGLGLSRTGLVVLTLLALLVFLPACSSQAPPQQDGASAEETPCREFFLEVGDTAPALTLATVEGASQSLEDLGKGKVLLVDFWATWCAPCIAAMPHVEAMHQKYKDQGLMVVGVMADGNAAKIAGDKIPKLGVTYTMLVDENGEKTGCAWGPLVGYPTMVMIGQDGKVAGAWFGTIDVSSVEEAVEALFSPVVGS